MKSVSSWTLNEIFKNALSTCLQPKLSRKKRSRQIFAEYIVKMSFFSFISFCILISMTFFSSVPEFDSHAHCAPKWHYQVDGATPFSHFNIFPLTNFSASELRSLLHDSFVLVRFFFQREVLFSARGFIFSKPPKWMKKLEIWANNVMRTYILSRLFAFHLSCLLQYWMAHIQDMLRMFFSP